MYQQLYSILASFAYGADAVLTNYQDLCVTIFATICVYFLLALPFLVCFWIIRWVWGVFFA